MRKFLAALSFMIFMIFVGVAGCDHASDVATIEAVDNAAAQLDEAFSTQDTAAIKARMTPDHVAVTHFYPKPQTVDEQIASLPKLKYKQIEQGEPNVVLLGQDVAMRTLTAKFDGTFEGRSLSGDVFITSILVKQDGKWLERFYQVTRIAF